MLPIPVSDGATGVGATRVLRLWSHRSTFATFDAVNPEYVKALGQRTRVIQVALLLALALVGSSCAADETGTSTTAARTTSVAPTTTVLDCVTAGTCTDATTSTQAAVTATPAAGESTYNGFQVGFTEDGYAYLGDPDAPVSLIEFSDYLCPFCGRHAAETNPQLIERYAASGQVRFVFRDYPLAELHPTAPSGHVAALCVAEQGPALFWAMHDQLFARQSEWASLADNSSYLAAIAEEVGANLDAYKACLESGSTVAIVDQRVAQARQLGFSGTPGFQIVDNRTDEVFEVVGAQPVETFVAAIAAVISGETPTTTDPPDDKPDLPFSKSPTFSVPSVSATVWRHSRYSMMCTSIPSR
jgi:protein-disulfide isomerase